jgi:proteasome assembly chaperone (PAC2) family protein
VAALLSPLLLIVAIVLLVWKGFNMFKATAACLMMLAATRGFLIDVSSAKQNFQIAVK